MPKFSGLFDGALLMKLVAALVVQLEKHGDELFDLLWQMIWKKISPDTAPEVFAAADSEKVSIVEAFGCECDEIIAAHKASGS